MNKEALNKLKELAQAAENEVIRSHGWAGSVEMLETLRIDEEYLTAASPAAILELIALAEHSLSAQDEVLTDERLDKIAYDFIPGSTVTAGSLRRFGRAVEFEALAAAVPSPAIAVEPVAQMICPNCGKNRFKETCPSTGNCPMIADAHLLAPPALAGSQVQAAGDAPVDPMDWPLPCDVKVGHGTHRKGCTLGSLVARMKVLYDMVQDTQPRLTDEQRDIMQKYFGAKPNADCSGEPANCPDNEGYGCACDPMNKAVLAMREQS